MSSESQQQQPQPQIEEDDPSKLLEHEAGCDILLKKEAIQLSSGDFESRKRLEMLEDDDGDDGDDENGDDSDDDEDALGDGLASATTNFQSLMPGYSSQADEDDDEDDDGVYNTLLDYYGDNELLSSGKDVTIVDTTGDALVRGTVCAKTEYNSVNAKKMDELWEEIGNDVYGAMQRIDLDDVVVNYNQHSFDICGYANGRLMTVIQHPIFTVIAPFD